MGFVHDHNRRAWDARALQGAVFARPAADDFFENVLGRLDSRNWLGGDVRGKRVLCLGGGGGKAGPMFAAAGAIVTVVDISPRMLALDRQVAAERGLNLAVVEASMDDLGALPAATFDIVSQPVSTCYVPDVLAVYREVARLTVPGGLYVSQHKQPASLQATLERSARGYELVEPYYRSGPLPPSPECPLREQGTLEFLHRWEELVGGLCRAGFVVEDLVEPLHADPAAAAGSFADRSRYVPPYVRIKARRTGAAPAGDPPPRLWLPAAE